MKIYFAGNVSCPKGYIINHIFYRKNKKIKIRRLLTYFEISNNQRTINDELKIIMKDK